MPFLCLYGIRELASSDLGAEWTTLSAGSETGVTALNPSLSALTYQSNWCGTNLGYTPLATSINVVCKSERGNENVNTTLATYPYAIKNQRKARNAPSRGHFVPKPLVGGFGCLELVLYGIRELA